MLSRPAEEFGNDPSLETMWAIKAYEHAEIYFNVRIFTIFKCITFHFYDFVHKIPTVSKISIN